MIKLVSLVMRPRHPHRKQIKTDCEAKFLTDSILNNNIGKSFN